MDKKVILQKNSILLFIVNIIVLLSLVLFKNVFSSLGYNDLWVNIMFVLNIFILVIGVIFNIKFINYVDKYDIKKSCIVIIICFVLFLVINISGALIINKITADKYSKMSDMLLKYCKKIECSKYEIKKKNKYYDFVMENFYYDYSGIQNRYIIHNLYDDKKIISLTAEVYSKSNSFSETLISEIVNNYFSNFNINVDSDKIREAFDYRFEQTYIKDNKFKYKVVEIYQKNNLTELKTEIVYD